MVLIWILVFIVSLAVLIKATDYFIDSAEKVGVHFKIEPFIIGVFVLGVGTSLPELAVSILAMLEETSEVAAGNVIGSNITNLFLILGFAAVVVKNAVIKYDFLAFDLPLFIASAFFLAITTWNGTFGLGSGIFFLGLFAIYIAYSVSNHRKKQLIVPQEVKEAEKEKKKLGAPVIAKLIIAPIFIYLGAKYTVGAVVGISTALSIGADIIAASAIALGTSLPELAVSYGTLKKGKIDEMLGNIIGSNIFNTFVVMGIPALIGTIIIPQSMIAFALPVMLVATIISFIIIYDKKITRGEGVALLMFYAFFLLKLYNLI